MAVKQFTSTTLSSSDVNTYLANSGLVYVKSQTVGSGVTSVTVPDAFSATYLNYKIVYTGGVASSNDDIWLRLGSANTTYAFQLLYGAYANAASAYGGTTGSNFPVVGGAQSSIATVNCDLFQPFANSYTTCMSIMNSNTGAGVFSGQHRTASSFTAFTLGCNTATLTGGTITVYGFRLG